MIKDKKIHFIIFALFVSFSLTGCTNDEKLQQHDFNQLIIQLDQVIPSLLDKYEAAITAYKKLKNDFEEQKVKADDAHDYSLH